MAIRHDLVARSLSMHPTVKLDMAAGVDPGIGTGAAAITLMIGV